MSKAGVFGEPTVSSACWPSFRDPDAPEHGGSDCGRPPACGGTSASAEGVGESQAGVGRSAARVTSACARLKAVPSAPSLPAAGVVLTGPLPHLLVPGSISLP